jgi:hypothetical protein
MLKNKFVQKFLAICTFFILLAVGVILIFSLLVAPTRSIYKSTSPINQTVEIELSTQGFWGETWIDLTKSRKKRIKIYSEEGNEVIFPKDIVAVWSRKGSKFFLASKSIWTQIPRDIEKNPLIYFTDEAEFHDDWQGKYYVIFLMYDLDEETLLHNLRRNSEKIQYKRLDRTNLRNSEWNDFEFLKNNK